MRIPILLLALTLLATGCPGTAGPGARTRRDSGATLQPDGTIAWPTAPNLESGIGVPPGTEAGVAPAPQPGVEAGPPPTPACTPIDGACSSGQAACCSGGHCVDFPSVGPKCAKICTGHAECTTNCCVKTSQSVSVCGPATYCPTQNPPPADPPPQNPPPQNPPPQNPPPNGSSCQGSCGGQAASGCYCDYMCLMYGDCCADMMLFCIF